MKFRSQIIKARDYHRHARDLALAGLPLPVFMGTMINVLELSLHWSLVVGAAGGTSLLWYIVTGRKQMKLLDGSLIELDEQQLTLKNANGKITETRAISDLPQFSLHSDFHMADETARRVWNRVVKAHDYRHYLSWVEQGEPREVEFLPDSYYMLNRLKHLRDKWIEQGFLTPDAGERAA